MSHKSSLRRRDGDLTLTITVVGVTDIARFAFGCLLPAQCEFSATGRKVMRGLRRALGTARFRELDQWLAGGAMWVHSINRSGWLL